MSPLQRAIPYQRQMKPCIITFPTRKISPKTCTGSNVHILRILRPRYVKLAQAYINFHLQVHRDQGFIPRLKVHLLGRLLGVDFEGEEIEVSAEERDTVKILGSTIYSSKVLRVNYTTYDVMRDQDSMNPRTNCDVMVHTGETGSTAHRFWYARVLGVFHAQVLHTGGSATNHSVQPMEFLWVRWFGIADEHKHGLKVARLPKVGFVPDTDPCAFGFLDPSLVVRGAHLIPAFCEGKTSSLLTVPRTLGRPQGETEDWTRFYVNM